MLKLGEKVPTFKAWSKITGKQVIVDERTFNPEEHSMERPAGGSRKPAEAPKDE